MPSPQLPVVALISSAGGIEALSTVLQALPAGFPAAVIALQHLSPDHDSLLPAILQRACVLNVQPATDGEHLRAGHVHVTPPGVHTLITPESRISLVHSGAFPPSRPSADLLLTTLALAVGPAAVAVVLTGGGHDGATGATVVHKHGGTVMAADEETSQMWAMPSATIRRDSINPTVVALGQMGSYVNDLVDRLNVAEEP